jgi:hypothetical protein
MGTDIHLFVERRESAGEPWRPVVVRALPCWSCKDATKAACRWCSGTGLEAGYGDRNYDLFAMLADVRNGHGFAGVDTGDGFQPIAKPRGLPDDLSAELLAAHRDDDNDESYDDQREALGCGWVGDHSFSWLTLRELLAYDLTQTTKHRGHVSPQQFREFVKDGKPGSWCGGASGANVVHISNEAMADLVSSDRALDGKSYYTRVEWVETYAESAGRFFNVFVPALQALGGSPDDARIVFGFDS